MRVSYPPTCIICMCICTFVVVVYVWIGVGKGRIIKFQMKKVSKARRAYSAVDADWGVCVYILPWQMREWMSIWCLPCYVDIHIYIPTYM